MATPPPTSVAAPPAMPLARANQPKGWLATLVILLIMVGIPVGGVLAANAVAGLPDQPVDAGHGVIVAIPANWEYAGRFGDDRIVLITRGSASVAVSVKESTDEVAQLTALRNEWLASGTVSAGDVVAVADARTDGRPASRFPYTGTFGEDGPSSPVEGEATGVRGNGIVVIFDAWAGEGEFVRVAQEVAQIIRETTIP